MSDTYPLNRTHFSIVGSALIDSCVPLLLDVDTFARVTRRLGYLRCSKSPGMYFWGTLYNILGKYIMWRPTISRVMAEKLSHVVEWKLLRL